MIPGWRGCRVYCYVDGVGGGCGHDMQVVAGVGVVVRT